MNKFFNITFILIFYSAFAHKNVIFEKTYGNVNLVSSTSFYTEEVNKNIITAKYTDLLLKEMNFNESIRLRLTQDLELKIFAFYNNDENEKILNIVIDNRETDIAKTLNFIENVISNIKSIKSKKESFENWYNSESTSLVKKILSNKIKRPREVEEFKSSNYYFDYYYQNETYHILSYQNREVIEVAKMKRMLQFTTPTSNLLFVFTDLDSLTIINADYKYNFDEKKYSPTSKTIDLKFEPEWIYSFRPYKIRLLGLKYVTIESIDGNQVSLYNIAKKSLIQDLSVKIEE